MKSLDLYLTTVEWVVAIKLVGVNTPEDDRCIYPDSDVEFDDVLPYVEE